MKILVIGKYPPIQGGVSVSTYWTCRALAQEGHEVHVVTNASQVEAQFRMYIRDCDKSMMEPDFTQEGGGRIKLHTISHVEERTYIPWATPFVTQLMGVSSNVVEQYGCDLVFAHYFEPYGIVASQVASWYGLPYVVKHAGSDLGKLSQHSDLAPAYKNMLKRATCVLTSNERLTGMLVALGAEKERCRISRSFVPLESYFKRSAQKMDVQDLLGKTDLWCEQLGFAVSVADQIKELNARPFMPGVFQLGIYGKIGLTKGSFDLLRAANIIKDLSEFQIIALTNGHTSILTRWLSLVKELGLAERVRVLPFVPHWHIPGFIRACDAVCFLERGFPIEIHGPRVPREILACGTCLILSKEIAERQFYWHNIIDGTNAVIIDDPRNHANFAQRMAYVVASRESAARIGIYGNNLFRHLQSGNFARLDVQSNPRRIVDRQLRTTLESVLDFLSSAVE